VRAHSIGQPRRAEIPFELPSHRALAFGDTLLEIDGELRVWHGEPVRDGARTLAASLARPPWFRSSLY